MKNFSFGFEKLKPVIYSWLFIFIIAVSANSGQDLDNGKAGRRSDIIFQNSTINALLEGLYDDDVTFEQLRKHGNLGIGTFNRLDGEMVAIDGEFYKIKAADGLAYPVPGNEKTPFSVVADFSADSSAILEKSLNLEELLKHIDTLLPSGNIFYAFRVEGKFSYVKTRSVLPQEKPYPRLVEVVKTQSVFEFKDVEGYLVGFWFPFYMKDINVPGYHFHFLSKDKKKGGHLLGCRTSKIRIEIDYISGFRLLLPESKDFRMMHLESKKSELDAVEK
ncbi:MAG: acetolactate decarboxylase [Candidatus Aminicenantes bacterium]|nr:acetolactate decarboxylase [Candidatus Aminicenantes bacterium]